MWKICFILGCVLPLAASIAQLESYAELQKPLFVTVAAGAVDRKDSVVSFAMPKGAAARAIHSPRRNQFKEPGFVTHGLESEDAVNLDEQL